MASIFAKTYAVLDFRSLVDFGSPSRSATEEQRSHSPSGSARALVLLLALVVLIVAQSYLDARRLPAAEGKTLFVVGLCLAAVAVISYRRALLPPWHVGGSLDSLPAPQSATWVSIILAGVLAAVAAVYAVQRAPRPDAPIVFLAALILPLPVVIARVRPRQTLQRLFGATDADWRLWVIEVSAFLAIFALAVWLRTVDLAAIPPYINVDEALDGVQAQYLRDGNYHNLFETTYADQTRLSFSVAALLLSLPGDQLVLLRLSSVVCGLLTLPFLYLTARMFLPRAFSLLVVFLLAVTALDINYSRMGILNIQAAPLMTASAYFLLRTVRDHRLGDAVACGVLGALAVYSYLPSRPMPFVVATVLLLMMVRDRRHWSRYVLLGAVMLAVAVFVAAPQLAFYVAHPQMLIGHGSWHLWFLPARESTTTAADMLAALSRQLDGTVWGLTYHYDKSFHFAANTKLLDTTTGILFFVGLVVCLMRVAHPTHLVLTVWVIVPMVLVGVIARDPPSSVRLCGVVPAICLMAVVGLHSIWDVLRRQGFWLSRAATLGAFVLVPVMTFAANYDTYFTRVAGTFTYDYPTEAARYLERNRGQVTTYIVGATLDPHHSVLKFLVPDVPTHVMFTWEEFLPIRQAVMGNAVFISNDSQAPAMAIIRDYYPNGALEELRRPDGRLVMAVYRVSGEDIAARQGLVGRYGGQTDGQPSVIRRDASIAFDWATDRPEAIPTTFSATWDGSLFAPTSGMFRLRLEGSGVVNLTIDRETVLTKNASTPAAEATVILAKGWHRLQVGYSTSGGSLRFLWALPDQQQMAAIDAQYFSTDTVIRGLRAAYHTGTEASGAPTMEAIEPALFNRHSGYTRAYGWKPYAVTWTGTLNAPASGAYRLAVKAFDGAFALTLDGNPVISFDKGVFERREATFSLEQGPHRIEMSFQSPLGRTEALELWWAPPGQAALTPVPPSALSPP